MSDDLDSKYSSMAATKTWDCVGDDNKPKFPTTIMACVVIGIPMAMTFKLGMGFYTYLFLQTLLVVPLFVGFVYTMSNWQQPQTSGDCTEYLTFADKQMETSYKGRKIAFETLVEAYLDNKVELKEDLYETLLKRNKWAHFAFTPGHISFLAKQFIKDVLAHTSAQDVAQVTEHYDRGNDFYGAFLGERMIYTSAIYHHADETLEQAQDNKLKVVCDKIHLKENEKLLDIGCGWGTFVRYAAKVRGAKSTGVSLSKEQEKYHLDKCREDNVVGAEFRKCDYREIPFAKYNKITCLEMAEHVGVKRFQTFCVQVYNMLEDDGIFYLQIAGLRRAWQYEDLNWGLFMNKYVFPGADASCPLTFNIYHLERAGFEVRSVETVGVHYSKTLKHWYENWHKPENKTKILKNYGEKLFRQWSLFLGWSVIAAGEGKATCYQIVCHKNLNKFDRKVFIGEGPNGRP